MDTKIATRCLRVLILAAPLLSPSIAAAQHAVDVARDGVVRVVTLVRTRGGMTSSTGSGFVINSSGTIVTNEHVVSLAMQSGAAIGILTDRHARELAPSMNKALSSNIPPDKVGINVSGLIYDKLPKARVVWADKVRDLAVLQPESADMGTALPLVPSDNVHQGDRVYALGYPGVNDQMGPSAYVTMTQNEGEISSKTSANFADVGVYQISSNVRHGMSGGPLINACGEAVAVNGWGMVKVGRDLSDVDKAEYSIMVDTLMTVLDVQKIPYTRARSRCDPNGRDPLLTAAVVLSLACGGGVLMLVTTKRGRRVMRHVGDEFSRRIPSSVRPVQQPAKPAFVSGGSAGLPRPMPKPALAAMLHGVSGQFAGDSLPVTEDPITIGRDPRVSNLVFASDASRVSNRHCSLRYDHALGGVVLEDLGSTNGTFLGSGQELKQGRPHVLKAKDRFYLGDPVNLFEVRFETPGMNLDIGSLSNAGGRKNNEDYADFLQLDEATCWILADGLGGHRGGSVASRTAVEAGLKSFRSNRAVSADAVAAHFTHAQAALLERGRSDPALAQMQSTMVVLVSDGGTAVWGHIGDSRVYYLRAGSVAARTRDHSVVQAMVDAGEVPAEAQGQHPERARLLRVLGEEGDLRPAILDQPQPLAGDDAFLLCSDGFWEALGDTEIELDFAGSDTAESWLARMERRIRPRLRDTADNYTATAVIFTSAAVPLVPPPRTPELVAAASAAAPTERETQPVPRQARSRRMQVAALLLLVAAFVLGFVLRRPIARLFGAAPAPPGRLSQPEQQPGTPMPGPGASASPTGADQPPVPIGGTPSSAEPAGAAGPGVVLLPAKPSYPSPARVPGGTIYRPSTQATYATLQQSLIDAGPGEEVWLGPGDYREAVEPITREVHLKGAGRDATKLTFSGGKGLVITADGGSVEDVDLCCTTSGPVLELGGAFRGRVARSRIRDGADIGLLVRDRARPLISGTEIVGNRAGQVTVRDKARPTIQP